MNNGQYIVAPINVTLQTHIATQVAVIHLPENIMNADWGYLFQNIMNADWRYLFQNIMNADWGYLFQKATAEVKHFVKNNSVWKDGILYHTARILSMQEIDGQSNLSDVCLDLSAVTFCVPITDALSPIGYAIVSEVHWYDPDVKHKGVETVLRYCQNIAYVIGGRTLVKSIKNSCIKCRILHKENIRVSMGLLGKNNLTISPVLSLSS